MIVHRNETYPYFVDSEREERFDQCQFLAGARFHRSVELTNCTGQNPDGVETGDAYQFIGPDVERYKIQGGEVSNAPGDELISVVHNSPEGIISGVTLRDSPKGILIGSGDNHPAEGHAETYMESVRFINIGRRAPYQRGGYLCMNYCMHDGWRRWLRSGKSYAVRMEDGCVANIRNGWWSNRANFDLLDIIHGGGFWRGIKTDGTCDITVTHPVVKGPCILHKNIERYAR